MLTKDLLTGKLVRLAAPDLDQIAKSYALWNRNSAFWRLSDSGPAFTHSEKAIRKWFEDDLDKDPPKYYMFLIRRLADDRLIGDIGLGGIDFVRGDAFVGIGIGDPDCWGKGYGTEAMQLAVRFAFVELNLSRVTLTVFGYNPRAIRSYEKVGFQFEGREREYLNRDGERADVLWMGILREDWLMRQKPLIGQEMEA